MKNSISILLVLILGYFSTCLAQNTHNGISLNKKYENTSQEAIFVHYNTTLLFAGEYLYYKVYCINTNTNNLSKISKIAYVELVNAEGENVFKHKIELIDSEGYSDFFVPTSVPSGNYKLLAYTQWMKNLGSVSYFFQADVGVVNPYRGNQSAISTIMASGDEVSERIIQKKAEMEPQVKQNKLESFIIISNKKLYKKREAVTLTLKNSKRILGHGNYSLSVKKLEPIPQTALKSSLDFDAKRNPQVYPKGILYAPELSGSLISGRVLDIGTNLPVKDANVAISVSGENFFFRVVTSDFYGNFRFWLDPDYDSDNAIIQVVSDTKENYKIEMYSSNSVNYSGIKFASFTITKDMKDLIVERSIFNQIDNAYYSIKPDTIKPSIPKKPFTYYEKITSYNLDDYSRFSTMKEVFTEIVENVWTRSDANGNEVVRVRNYEYDEETEFLPLIFVDGVFVQDHQTLLVYDALKVDKVGILRDRYKFGTQKYQGVVLIETIAQDYTSRQSGDYLKDFGLFKPQSRKSYFQQTYMEKEEQLTKRIPDFRSQLLWEPSIDLVTNEMSFQFYTSDNLGEYQISLEGFTIEGKPVSIREVISVVE